MNMDHTLLVKSSMCRKEFSPRANYILTFNSGIISGLGVYGAPLLRQDILNCDHTTEFLRLSPKAIIKDPPQLFFHLKKLFLVKIQPPKPLLVALLSFGPFSEQTQRKPI